jgi:hypothetical protein
MTIAWEKAGLATLATLGFGVSLTSSPASANDAWIVPCVAAGVLGGLALVAARGRPPRLASIDRFGELKPTSKA